MDRARPCFLLVTLAVTVACHDPAAGPARIGAPALSVGSDAGCPATADLVVRNEAELVAALDAAAPGDVIALDGTIAVTSDVTVGSSVTLTCATPGSGLAVAPGATVISLLNVTAAFVTVDGLVLDGTGTLNGPYFALNDPGDLDGDGVTGTAANVSLMNSTVTCGPGECAFLVAVPGAVITGNRFTSHGSLTGIHLQAFGGVGTDSSRVARNTIIARAPSTVATFGAIRLRDGSDVTVAANEVRGPWANSLALADLSHSRIEHNRLDGAQFFGIRAQAGVSFLPVSITDNAFRNNQISGAAGAGIFLSSACRNDLFGNNLQGHAGDLGAVFDVPTGANIMVGNMNVVIDNGDLDCDGDGVADPNVITGPGRVSRGAPFVTLGGPETASTGRLR